MITEDYISFETAKLLKEKGFEGRMYTFYTEEGTETESAYVVPSNFFPIYRPTLQMAMKWLREKDLVICVVPLTFYYEEKVSTWGYNIWAADNLEIDEYNTPGYKSYEEACEAAIKYCLENLIKEDEK